jgi:flavodoxin
MKTLVVYYSFEGNCGLVAEKIASCLGAEKLEIKTVDEKKRTGFSKYAWGGSQVFMKKKPALKPYMVEIDKWDLIILGAPVWAASPAPAMISFLSQTKITGKKLALFCCHAGGLGGALEKFKALLPGNIIVGEIDFSKAAQTDPNELKQKIEAWAKTFKA